MKHSLAIILSMIFITCTGQDKLLVQPSFDIRVPHPPMAIAISGQLNLIYELHITNFSKESLLIEKIEILGSENSVSIAVLSEAEILKRLYIPGRKLEATIIDCGNIGVVYIEAVIKKLRPPEELFHRLTFKKSGQPAEQSQIEDGASTRIDQNSPIVMGAPLSGGPWAAVYEPSWERGHRRVLYTVDGKARIPGRFAIDFIKLDDTGQLAHGDRDVIKNWYGYGSDVLAVADGIISSTRDDFPESSTLTKHPKYFPNQATGNYISIEIGKNQFVFYEHLKPGSILVKPGQKVKKGDVIARLGFTGSTTGPHLHLHVADKDSPLGSEGIPFVIESFILLGNYPDFSEFDKARWQVEDSSTGSNVKNERPGANSVINFK